MSFTKPSTAVKWAVSSMTGAPTLSGTAGSLITLLDAFLVNGFGTKAVDSAQVTDGVCRLSFTGTSAALEHTVITVSGITGDGAVLNGEQRVSTVSSTYVEFACDLPDGPLTGTITFKMAPLGWEKVFSKTNVAVYRSADVAGTRCYLRVDDTDARNARVAGYETMISVDVGDKSFPSASQVSGGGYWPKANAANSTPRVWTLIGDAKGFWLHVQTSVSASEISGAVWGFGDVASVAGADAYSCAIFCAQSDVSASTALQSGSVEYMKAGGGGEMFMARSFTAVGSSLQCTHGLESLGPSGSDSGASGAVSCALAPQYPNPCGNALLLSRKAIVEPGVALRGFLRGIYLTTQQCHPSFSHRDRIEGSGMQAGKSLLAIKCGSPAGAVSQGVIFADITGPWEGV